MPAGCGMCFWRGRNIGTYNWAQVAFRVLEGFLKQVTLATICGMVTCIIVGAYVLVRFHGEFSYRIISVDGSVLVIMVIVTRIWYGMCAEVNRLTQKFLNLLKSWKVLPGMLNPFMAEYANSFKRNIHVRFVKSMRPIALLVGWGDFTFFSANAKNGIYILNIVMDQTVALG